MSKSKKIPPVGPVEKKVPSSSTRTGSIKTSDRVKFRFLGASHFYDSPWSLKKLSESDSHLVLNKILEYETWTLHEVFVSSGFFKQENLADSPAKGTSFNNLLIKIEETLGHSELISIRVSKIERLWACRENEELFVLLWDPTHTLWPSKKKHT